MPIHKVKGGYKWGSHGHTYPTREGAEKQAEAAHANGFHGDSSESFITIEPKEGEFLTLPMNDSTASPKTELDIAKAIKSGELSSPQQYENVVLFDLRITGTGLSKRDHPDEYVLRPAENFLTQEFVERCNGLPVIFEHPGESILTTDEYRERAIGTIILPYIKEDEVRGIAKIFDIDAANLMMETHISTSPGVVFRDDKESFYIDDLDGERVLVEGVPSYVDHLAICKSGVWDKGETPNGVNRGEITMPEEKPKEEVKKDSEGSTVEELLGKIMERMDAQDKRLDAMSKESRKDGDGENMPTEQLDGAKG
ncbi:MAG: DUF2213 domain-containing protein, partial [Nitrospiraceae bacterium]|nr:DUF2213 domain-containing protein [Nitrospiraceae bacterium]